MLYLATQHPHSLAGRPMPPQTKACQRVYLPSPEKEIFKNAPRATKKKDKVLINNIGEGGY